MGYTLTGSECLGLTGILSPGISFSAGSFNREGTLYRKEVSMEKKLTYEAQFLFPVFVYLQHGMVKVIHETQMVSSQSTCQNINRLTFPTCRERKHDSYAQLYLQQEKIIHSKSQEL
jgi:hypothetical protein